MTREELERIYNEPNTSLTREGLEAIYNEPVKQQKQSRAKAVGSPVIDDMLDKQNRLLQLSRNAKMQKNVIPEMNYNPNKGAEKTSAPISLEKKQENKFNDQWLDSSYTLSKEEENQAREYIKQYRKENNGFKNNPYETKEGIAQMQKVAELESKISDGTAMWGGFVDSLPFVDSLQNKLSDMFGNEDTKKGLEQQKQVIESAKKQSPISSNVGNIVGEMAKYAAGAQTAQAIPFLGQATQKAGQGVANVLSGLTDGKIGGQALASAVSGILGDTSLDIALDTLPSYLNDVNSGVSKQDAGKNALKNMGSNLAFNVLGEGVSNVAGKALNKVIDSRKSGQIESLNPLEDYVKKMNDATSETDGLQEKLLESSQELIDGLKNSPKKHNEVNDFTIKAMDVNDSSKKNSIVLGEGTRVKGAYTGNDTLPIQETKNNERIVIKQENIDNARINWDKAHSDSQLLGQGRSTILGKIYETLFDYNNIKKKEISVDGLKLEGKPYIVTVNKNAVGKIASDSDLDYKKLAILDEIDEIVSKANYVGSADFVNYKNSKKGRDIKRYDYFENHVDFEGKDYIVSFSVAVEPGQNKYRTHTVIDEIKLHQASRADTAVVEAGALNTDRVLFNDSIPNSELSVNEITDFRKQNIPNHDEFNKYIDKYVGMYGDEATKAKALEFKNDLNELLQTNSDEAWEKVIADVTDLDRMMEGKSYTFKRQKKNKNRSAPPQSAKYNNELRELFAMETDSIAAEALENGKKVNGKISKSRTNTLENSGINTQEELANKYLDENNFRYMEISEKESMEEATTRVSLNSDHWKNKLMNQDKLSGIDVDTMMLIYTDTVQKARQSNDDELWKEAGQIFKHIQEAGTKGGQLVQSFAKWSRNTPEGVVAESVRQAKEQASKVYGDKKTQAIIDNLYEAHQKEIQTLAETAFSAGVDTREGKEAFAKIGKIISQNTPKSISGVVKTYLMDSMLLNFRTLISRNALGNLGYNAMELARQPITALADRGVSKITGKRTRTGWSKDKVVSAIEGAAKGLKEEGQDLLSGIHTAKSGENTIENAIQLNNSPLKGKNPVSKALNKIDDITKHALSVGDRPFYEAAYKQRMTELADLRKRGALGEEISNMSDADFNQMAELSAKMDGLVATYQDSGAMAEALSNMKKSLADFSKAGFGVDVLSQFAMPFVNTPGNIITRSLEYSPLGLLKNAVNTGIDIRRGDFSKNQQRFVDELGRNILGTGLFAGGIAAYDNGYLTGGYSDDKDMKNAQKNSGMQEYALQGKDGEWNFDVSWIPVLGNNMVTAAATKEAFDQGEDFMDSLGKAASTSAGALLGTSALQGFNRMFGGNTSYGEASNIFDNAVETLQSGTGQAIPSLMRQVAQSKDTYERELGDGERKYWQNSLMNSIPWLRDDLQPKIDNEGNIVLQNQGRGLGSRILENMISPGKFTEITHSPLNEEAMRLHEATGNNVAFIPTAARKDIVTDDFEPTDAEYRQYKEKIGGYNSEVAGALIESNFYQTLSDSEKEAVLSDIYSGMKAVAKMETLPSYTSDSRIAKEYKNGGAEAVLNYLQKKKDFEDLDVDMDGKKAQEAYLKGGKKGLEEYVTHKTKADIDGNGKLRKEEELIPYLESTGWDRNTKGYWFSMFSTAENPYY